MAATAALVALVAIARALPPKQRRARVQRCSAATSATRALCSAAMGKPSASRATSSRLTTTSMSALSSWAVSFRCVTAGASATILHSLAPSEICTSRTFCMRGHTRTSRSSI
eukprot:3241722-Pleurochrysis_carterae.AAC.1